MNRRLERLFLRLEQLKQDVLSEVSTWPEDRLRFRPSSTEWSTLQVIDHLAKVEASILREVERNLPAGHPVGLRDRVGASMISLVMRSPLRVKVPESARQVVPDPEDSTLAGVQREWDEAQGRMARLLNDFPDGQMQMGYFAHPRAGWMTISQTLEFIAIHFRHHAYQLKRLQKQSLVQEAFTQPASS